MMKLFHFVFSSKQGTKSEKKINRFILMILLNMHLLSFHKSTDFIFSLST